MIFRYDRLQHLQGKCVPQLYIGSMGHGNGFGILVLEYCGESMKDGWHLGTKELARKALSKIHATGVLHRDISLRNITYDSQNTSFPLRIIDFGEATLDTELVTEDEMNSELEKLEQL